MYHRQRAGEGREQFRCAYYLFFAYYSMNSMHTRAAKRVCSQSSIISFPDQDRVLTIQIKPSHLKINHYFINNNWTVQIQQD